MAYMGYDTHKKAYTYDEFNSRGEAQHSTGTVDGDTWTWNGEKHLRGNTTKTLHHKDTLGGVLHIQV